MYWQYTTGDRLVLIHPSRKIHLDVTLLGIIVSYLCLARWLHSWPPIIVYFQHSYKIFVLFRTYVSMRETGANILPKYLCHFILSNIYSSNIHRNFKVLIFCKWIIFRYFYHMRTVSCVVDRFENFKKVIVNPFNRL